PSPPFCGANTRPNSLNAIACLVPLDRQPLSPMELLHVSGFKPHLLTQQFVTVVNGARTPFTHYAPWFDQNIASGNSALLYRLFEFVETRNRASGMMPVTTTLSAGIKAGNNVTATPVAMNGNAPSGGPWSIQAGSIVIVADANGGNQENVRVTAVTKNNFTANFLKDHAGGSTVFVTTMGDRLP